MNWLNSVDWFLIRHIGMTHPDMFLMWMAIILTPLNSLTFLFLWRKQWQKS